MGYKKHHIALMSFEVINATMTITTNSQFEYFCAFTALDVSRPVIHLLTFVTFNFSPSKDATHYLALSQNI